MDSCVFLLSHIISITFIALNPTTKKGNDMENKDTEHEEEFQPKGAVAFFIFLIVLFSIIWFGLYFEMLGRI